MTTKTSGTNLNLLRCHQCGMKRWIATWIMNRPICSFCLARHLKDKPCEEALADLVHSYNGLADRIEEAWAENQRLKEAIEQMGDHVVSLEKIGKRALGV